jgi:hypothetical protein
MQITKTHLRAAAFVVGGAALGAIATAATSAGRGEPKPFVGDALGAGVEGPASNLDALDPAAAAIPADASAAVRHAAPASDAALDPRFLASPLSERFTQWSRGASNPGVRQAPHRDPLSEMIAAVFPADEDVRTVMLAPRVNPPPPPPDDDDDEEEEENEEPCDDDPSCDGDDTCPPPGDTCEPPPSGVPEIDADLLGTGLLLLVGGALVLASRRTL